jgi:hypothetical protein
MNPLETVELKLKELITQREQIEREIAGLEEAKKILTPIYTQPTAIPSIEELVETADVGITDAVRRALRLNAHQKLTAVQVRDAMVSQGVDLSKYKNAMATIHQVLRRLVEAKQVAPSMQGAFPGPERVFQWIEKQAPRPGTLGAILAGMPSSRDSESIRRVLRGESLIMPTSLATLAGIKTKEEKK